MRLFQSTIGDSRIDFERYHRPYAMNSYIISFSVQYLAFTLQYDGSAYFNNF